MIILRDDLFPTRILLVDDLLKEEHISSIKEDILSSPKRQSHSKLQYEKPYKELVEKIYAVAQSYFDDMMWSVEDYQITDMWSNLLKPGESHSLHTHSNNILSGVYYVKTNETSTIQFYDPRPQTRILIPKAKLDNKENSQTWFYPSFVNRLIMFPSWLEHDVPVTQEERISISWNIMFKGKIGSSEKYQSAEF